MTLYSKKMKYFRSLASSLIFMAFGARLAIYSGSIAGWIIALFFGFAAIASLIPVLPKQSFLKIDVHGFTIRSMFRNIRIKWNEVESFEASKRNLKDIVTYSYINKASKNYVNVENLIGKREVLPDIYGMNARDLADLMEYYRIRSGFVNEAEANPGMN